MLKNTVATFTWVSWGAQDPGGGGVAAAALRPGVQQHVARREARARDAVVAGEHEADLGTCLVITCLHCSSYTPCCQSWSGQAAGSSRSIAPSILLEYSSVFYIGELVIASQTYVVCTTTNIKCQ